MAFLLGTGMRKIGKHTAGEEVSPFGKLVKQRRFPGRQIGDLHD